MVRMDFRRFLLVLGVVVALALTGCSERGCSWGAKDYQSDIQALWDASSGTKDWRCDVGLQYVTPHGDKDGPQGGVVGAAKKVAGAVDQRYSLLYESKSVPRFRMLGYCDIPANDSRPFEERASGYLSLWPTRFADIPDAEGFMKHWVSETGGDTMMGFTEDMTIASKYPGMRVYRTQDNRSVPGTSLEDWEGREGPVMGYDTAKKQWVTLEEGKPKPPVEED